MKLTPWYWYRLDTVGVALTLLLAGITASRSTVIWFGPPPHLVPLCSLIIPASALLPSLLLALYYPRTATMPCYPHTATMPRDAPHS